MGFDLTRFAGTPYMTPGAYQQFGILGGGNAGSTGGILGGGGSQPYSFSQIMDPSVILPAAAAIAGAPTFRQSLAGGMAALAPGLANQKKRKAINDWVKAGAPKDPNDPATQALFSAAPDLAEKYIGTQLGATGVADTGLTPQWAQDAAGKWHQFLPSRSGTAKELQYPEGISPTPPGDIAQQKALGAGLGKGQAAAAVDLPRAENAGQMMLDMIDQTLADPYLDSMVGPVQGRLPNVSGEAGRVQGLLDQIQGGAFLQAYAVLKGGGQITEIEGAKATAALNRLQHTEMGSGDYRKALIEFRNEVQKLMQVAQQRAAGSSASPAAPEAEAATGDGWTDLGNGVRIRVKQ